VAGRAEGAGKRGLGIGIGPDLVLGQWWGTGDLFLTILRIPEIAHKVRQMWDKDQDLELYDPSPRQGSREGSEGESSKKGGVQNGDRNRRGHWQLPRQ